MTDYMQKARDELRTTFAIHDNMTVVVLARTLEALDTANTRADAAEKRERELREVVAYALEWTDADLYPEVFARLSACVQPEPDPSHVARAAAWAEANRRFHSASATPQSLQELYHEELAKYGLSIVKGESL